ncbi:site-specific integrase [Enterococcus sp. 669A]|uniref:Site-specific integrase n=1 Tax=Candidatus Enterococcus moelleringii TaxID=2815325 RepID=A0ABS3LIH2_9ENTE|nr:site-specific integrase [Enterococcus sp. 669A]MBO1308895.1 site-specific integrase [Enterococcus sp. 669A]
MPRRGENIYKRKDGRWEGRYHIGRKSNGRLRYGYVYGKSYREVKDKIGPLRKKMELLAHYHAVGGMTYQEWMSLWLSEVQDTVKESTFSSYSYKVQQYLLPHLAELSLSEITEEHVQKVVKHWLEDGLSVSSVKLIVGLLSRTLKAAEGKGKIARNPCKEVKLPKGKKKKVRALSKLEQKRLEKVVAKEKGDNGLPAILAMHTGMRIGEIAALKWENVLFDQNLILVESTYQRVSVADTNQTVLHYGSVKSASSCRVIPMSDKIRKDLQAKKLKADNEFVFSVNGKPCEPRLLTYHFHQIRKKAKLEDVHFHQLRHTFATRCLESGADIPSVSALLGHSSTQMTLDIYSDSMLEQRIIAISSMERALA